LDVAAASEYAGWSVRYTRRLIAERRIAVVKLRGRVFLDPDDIDGLIAACRIEAAQ